MQTQMRSARVISSVNSSLRKMKVIKFLKNKVIDGVSYVIDQPVMFPLTTANSLIAAVDAAEFVGLGAWTDHETNRVVRG